MTYRMLKQYMFLCELNGWKPSWEGLRAFKEIGHLRKQWTGR